MNIHENTKNHSTNDMGTSVLNLLNNENFRTYNIIIAKALGSVNAAIMLSELVQRFQYHESRDELIESSKSEGKWFYYTQDIAEDRLGLSRKDQDYALKILESEGLIKKIILGVPGKRHFQLNVNKIIEISKFSKKNSRLSESDKLDCPDRTNCFDPNGQSIYKETYKENHQDDDDDARERPREENAFQKEILSISDIYRFSLSKKKDWTNLEIEEAWKKYSAVNHRISDTYKYFETIINNQRILNNKTKKEESCKKSAETNRESKTKKPSNESLDKDKKIYSASDMSESPLAKLEREIKQQKLPNFVQGVKIF